MQNDSDSAAVDPKIGSYVTRSAGYSNLKAVISFVS